MASYSARRASSPFFVLIAFATIAVCVGYLAGWGENRPTPLHLGLGIAATITILTYAWLYADNYRNSAIWLALIWLFLAVGVAAIRVLSPGGNLLWRLAE